MGYVMDITYSNKFMRLIAVLAMALFAFTSAQGTAFADDVNAVVEIGPDATVGAVSTEINRATDTNILSYEENILTFNNAEYSELDSTERYDYMRTALSGVRESSLNTMNKNKMFNFIADQDTTTSSALRNLQNDAQADVVTATTWLKPFNGIFGTFLGLLTMIIFMFLALSTAIDVAYIALPALRVFMGRRGADGVKPPFVTEAAFSAIRDSETSSNSEYQDAMVVYFKRRVLHFVIVGICLLYLLSGQIWGVIGFFVDAFRPAADQINFWE